MRVNATRKDVEPARVEFVSVFIQVPPHFCDAAISDRDVHVLDAAGRDDVSAADDHGSSRKRPRTSIATATSAVSTDSAGLWLMPPLQRTNSIPMSVISDI